MLTKKQHELLLYINEYLTDNGVSPSFDEMKEALGLKSKSGIHRLITALVERGFIRRLPHRARAVDRHTAGGRRPVADARDRVRQCLDHLDGSGCLAMVTTHLGDLKTYAFGNDSAENAAVEFDSETLRPTYRLCIGQFGMS